MEFEEICRENYARIYNYILAKTGEKETAENTVTPISAEEGTSSTPWLSKKVWDDTYEIWDSDDAVN